MAPRHGSEKANFSKRVLDEDDFVIKGGKKAWTTGTFRVAVLVIVASMHPAGVAMLKAFGFNLPHDPIKVVESWQQKVDVKLDDLSDGQRALSRQVNVLRTDFDMFKVDFDKYRPQQK